MKSLEPWLRLVRLPNLITAPGDVLAGFFLAGGPAAPGGWGRLGYVVGASITLYAAGMILNDVVDRRVDAAERPERPIPAGEITVPAAGFVAAVAALSALNLASGAGGGPLSMPVAAAAALLALIALYDSPLRRRLPLVGVALMGLCRAANVALGASVCPLFARTEIFGFAVGCHSPAAYAGAFAVFLYVAAFSEIARHEAEPAPPRPSRRLALPFFAALVGVGAVLYLCLPGADAAPPPEPLARAVPAIVVFGCVLPVLNAFALWRIYPRHVPAPALVGRHIGNLMRLQAALVLASAVGGEAAFPAFAVAFAIYLAATLFRVLADRISPS